MPKVAVDQATGTLVMSWKDVRDDASRSRSAVYVTASSDGGPDLQSQVFANPTQDGDRRHHPADRRPEPSARQPGGTQTRPAPWDSALGWGWPSTAATSIRSGLRNFNRAHMTRTMRCRETPCKWLLGPCWIAAGPRIIDSTMGPVGGARRPASKSPSIVRSIHRLHAADVQVFYHDTINGDPFIPLKVINVQGGTKWSPSTPIKAPTARPAASPTTPALTVTSSRPRSSTGSAQRIQMARSPSSATRWIRTPTGLRARIR